MSLRNCIAAARIIHRIQSRLSGGQAEVWDKTAEGRRGPGPIAPEAFTLGLILGLVFAASMTGAFFGCWLWLKVADVAIGF